MGNTSTHETKEMKNEEVYSKPIEIPPPTIVGESSILTPNIISKLRKALPHTQRSHTVWNVLYSSVKQGLSNATFQKQTFLRGPTILLIKCDNGAIIGCFASHSWEISNKFYGSSDCFLFRIVNEDVIIYRPSFINNNFMYFNTGSKFNKCNAIGMGGQINYFALCINDDFIGGYCRAKTATFSTAPCLCDITKDYAEFKILNLEVIGFPLSEKEEIDLEYHSQLMEAKRNKSVINPEGNSDLFILKSSGVIKDVG